MARPRVAVVGERRHHQRGAGPPFRPLPHASIPRIVDFFRPQARSGARLRSTRAWQGRQWLVGDSCTIADIGCWGRMVFMAEGGMSLDDAAQRAGVARPADGDAGLRAALRSHPQEGRRTAGLTRAVSADIGDPVAGRLVGAFDRAALREAVDGIGERDGDQQIGGEAAGCRESASPPDGRCDRGPAGPTSSAAVRRRRSRRRTARATRCRDACRGSASRRRRRPARCAAAPDSPTRPTPNSAASRIRP